MLETMLETMLEMLSPVEVSPICIRLACKSAAKVAR